MEIIIAAYIFLFLISFLFPRKRMKLYFFIISLTFAIIAFFFVPDVSFDLYRHYGVIDTFRKYGWNFGVITGEFPSLIIANGFFYLISFLPSNSFLPAITAFISYYALLNIIYKAAIKYNLNRKSMLLGAFFTVTTFNYLALMSGIRNWLAFSLFAYFLYIDLVENRRKVVCAIMYIALCFLHSSVWILVAFRIAAKFFNKLTSIIVIACLVGWSYYTNLIFYILNKFSNVKFINVLQDKISFYLVLPTENTTVKYQMISFIGIVIVFIYFIYFKGNNIKDMNTYFKFIILVIAFSFGSIKFYRVFISFVQLLCFLSPPCIMLMVSNLAAKFGKKEHSIYRYKLRGIILRNYILTLFIIVISIYNMIYLFKFQYFAIIFKL